MQLRDIHAPAHVIDGEVHWQMAAGADVVSVSVTANALHALGGRPLPGYLEVFETNRTWLCELASLRRAANAARSIKLDREDVLTARARV